MICPMRRFKAIFFDVGGTLLRMGRPEAAYRQLLLEHGYDFDLETVERAVAEARRVVRAIPSGPAADLTINGERERSRRDVMVCEILQRLGVGERFESCRLAIWESWLGTKVFQQYPEGAAVLARLKQRGYLLGAISNWEARLEALCRNHGLGEHFDFLLASEAEGYVKPGPFLFEKALRLAGVGPGEALHVGDNYREDVQAAQAVGIAAVLLAREGAPVAEHSPTIRTLDELLPLAEAAVWIQGEVVSGVGEAGRFLQVPWVRAQLIEQLGFEPFPGTLNLRVSAEADRAAFEWLKRQPEIPIEPEPGFCAARCYRVSLEGRLAAAVLIPEVPGYPPEALEIVAPVRLRDALPVRDGSLLTVAVETGW
jgi:HAD superfamily hydrolase (TIGR01549 family)